MMSQLAIQLPAYANQTELNLRRWEEVLADPTLARLEQRIETDRHGHIIMSPPPGSHHSDFQTKILLHLHRLLSHGEPRVEVPVSTPDGVRAADVAWTSDLRFKQIYDARAYREAPDICIEVISPSNTNEEMREKKALYFASGAREVWLCLRTGEMEFFSGSAPEQKMDRSEICANFPATIDD